MLDDSLDVQDLDTGEANNRTWDKVRSHSLLRHFYDVSLDAIQNAVRDSNGFLFEFGVEVQWRMCKYRLDVAVNFVINLGDLKKRGVALYKEYYEKNLDPVGHILKARKLALITAKDTHEKKSDDNKQDESKKKTTKKKKQIDKEEEKKKQRRTMIEWSKLPSFTWPVFTKYWEVALSCLKQVNVERKPDKESVQLEHNTGSATDTMLLFREESVSRENARKQNEKLAGGYLGRGQSKQNQHIAHVQFGQETFQWGIPEDKLGPKIEGLLLTGTQIVYNTTYRGSLRYRCYEVPIVKQGIQYILQALKNVNLVDNEGLRIIENAHCCAMLLLEKLVRKYHSKYSNCIHQRYPRALLWKEIGHFDRIP
ncbi:hypothetical protein RFI_35704 [Reticulomyxa filosa]|uniref:Uncharacterized protein n=1 Tax=Reticulomyxa filosa TaxID=46433 RepID=X6LKS4_RETFI|nr:hypothetical protein RFI_35704 [Reticulomyxa filosa]|eukprot:ETO01737.1 hypothetical protein RFI_35704 [Reticulomyxa filosa]